MIDEILSVEVALVPNDKRCAPRILNVNTVIKTMTESKRPFKILCLHGYRQDAKAFREKSGAFRKAVGKKAEFTFITAPHRVPSQAATEDEVSPEAAFKLALILIRFKGVLFNFNSTLIGHLIS